LACEGVFAAGSVVLNVNFAMENAEASPATAAVVPAKSSALSQILAMLSTRLVVGDEKDDRKIILGVSIVILGYLFALGLFCLYNTRSASVPARMTAIIKEVTSDIKDTCHYCSASSQKYFFGRNLCWTSKKDGSIDFANLSASPKGQAIVKELLLERFSPAPSGIKNSFLTKVFLGLVTNIVPMSIQATVDSFGDSTPSMSYLVFVLVIGQICGIVASFLMTNAYGGGSFVKLLRHLAVAITAIPVLSSINIVTNYNNVCGNMRDGVDAGCTFGMSVLFTVMWTAATMFLESEFVYPFAMSTGVHIFVWISLGVCSAVAWTVWGLYALPLAVSNHLFEFSKKSKNDANTVMIYFGVIFGALVVTTLLLYLFRSWYQKQSEKSCKIAVMYQGVDRNIKNIVNNAVHPVLAPIIGKCKADGTDA